MSGLVVPTCFGKCKKFNCTSRKTTTQVLIRVLLHNAITIQDIECEWTTPRVLKIAVAWPQWFQNAEQMAEFTKDDTGDILFPPEHALTVDTSERNQERVEEDGRVWNDGVIMFEEDMEDNPPILELLDVAIPTANSKVKVLQMFCKQVLPCFLFCVAASASVNPSFSVSMAAVTQGTKKKKAKERDVNLGTGHPTDARVSSSQIATTEDMNHAEKPKTNSDSSDDDDIDMLDD